MRAVGELQPGTRRDVAHGDRRVACPHQPFPRGIDHASRPPSGQSRAAAGIAIEARSGSSGLGAGGLLDAPSRLLVAD
jgi:hypothetical protein